MSEDLNICCGSRKNEHYRADGLAHPPYTQQGYPGFS